MSAGVAVDEFRATRSGAGAAPKLETRLTGTSQDSATVRYSGTPAWSGVVSVCSAVGARPDPKTVFHLTSISASMRDVSRNETGPPIAGREHDARRVNALPSGPRRNAVGKLASPVEQSAAVTSAPVTTLPSLSLDNVVTSLVHERSCDALAADALTEP